MSKYTDGLPAEIAALETRIAHMAAVNRIVRTRRLSPDQRALRLCLECGLKLAEADSLVTPDALGRTGFSCVTIDQAKRHARRLRRLLDHCRAL